MLRKLLGLSFFLAYCSSIADKKPDVSIIWQEPVEKGRAKDIKRIASFLRAKFYNDLEMIAPADKKFAYAITDLNQDGQPEFLVIVKGNFFCGKYGCSTFILDGKYQQLSRLWAATPPFYVLKSTEKGWHSLGVYSDLDSCLHYVQWSNDGYSEKPWEQVCTSIINYRIKEYFAGTLTVDYKF